MYSPDVLPDPLTTVLAQVRALPDAAGFAGVSAQERAAWLVGLRQLVDATEAVFTEALAAFDSHGDGETLHAARSTGAWLRGALKLAPGDANERVRIARGSAGHLAPTLHALGTGTITYDQLRAVERATRTVPAEQQPAATAVLTDLAKATDVAAVRIAGQRLRHVVDPDGALDETNRQFNRRYLHLSPLLDGMHQLDGLLDAEAATLLSTALAPFLVPAGADDTRTTPQRRADGLTELARATCDHTLLPEVAGQRPHLDVLVPLSALLGEPDQHSPAPAGPAAPSGPTGPTGPATLTGLGGGAPLPTLTTQRIACDAHVARVLLGPDSVPLDLGRRHRLFTPHQRHALAIRDGGCRFPGCHLPPAFTDAHHLHPWLHGGASDLANALLVCRHHHRALHEGSWTTTPATTGGANGPVTLTGPNGQTLTSHPRGP